MEGMTIAMLKTIAPIICFILLFAATLFIFPAKTIVGETIEQTKYETQLYIKK